MFNEHNYLLYTASDNKACDNYEVFKTENH